MAKARRLGVRAPVILAVDLAQGRFVMELIRGATLKDTINCVSRSLTSLNLMQLGEAVGGMIARLHNMDTVHGDLTSSNILVESSSNDLVLIDFGLSYGSNMVEDKAVDMYVLERALASTHPSCSGEIFEYVIKGYQQTSNNGRNILAKLADVQLRGRKRDMIG